MIIMKTKLLAFRCPVELMKRVDTVATIMNTTRSAIVLESLRILVSEVRARDGRLVPPFSGEFKLPEALRRAETD